MNKPEIIKLAMKQLATDLNCNYEDFTKEKNTITTYRQLEGNRPFSSQDYFMKIATFGNGAVISANPIIHSWCKEYFSKHSGIRLFEHPVMNEIDEELLKYNQKLDPIHELYLPYENFTRINSKNIAIKWFEREDIPHLYSDPRFKNALLYDINSPRPDILAVASYDGDHITGMAGASMDSTMFWQIGIDVLPGYRQSGIATYLVNLLTEEILKRGAIPYYGTWCSNIASRNIAQICGYFPAWVEMHTVAKISEID